MITAINETTGNAHSVRSNAAGRLLTEGTNRFVDLGCVISGEEGEPGYQVPTSAIAHANITHTGMGWVRVLIFGLETTGAFDVGFTRYVSGISSLVAIAGGVSGTTTKALTPEDLTGKSIPGDTCKFYIKNVGASAVDASLYVQVTA